MAGIWGNSNYDSQKEGQEGARKAILEGIEEQFNAAIHKILTGEDSADESEIDWDDPFFAASKAPRIGKPPGASEKETPEQAEKRALMEELDQT